MLTPELSDTTMKMDKQEFWRLINDSREKSEGDQELQEQLLIDGLKAHTPDQIVEFESILREYLIEADDFKIIAAQKIIEGSVSDDSYLYFRCWLIVQGDTVFLNALDDPDTLADVIEELYSEFDEVLEFEELLYVATTAFEQRTGREEDEDDTFPRAVASTRGLEYDFNVVTKGKDWTEEQLPMMFPKLWEKFNN